AEEAAPEASQPEEAMPGLRAPETPLDSALLDAVSQSLRKFPEVEWASEVADDTGSPVIAVRVDPSFQTRMADIEHAVFDAGERAGTKFLVLMLTTPQQMKEARSLGGTFFPWRKRAVPKR